MTDAAGSGRASGDGVARPTRAAYRRFHRVSTRWSDNDAYGHVNNTLHYAFIDTAVNRLLIDVGLLDVSHSPAIGLVVETGCRYLASISYPDDVHVGMRVGHLGRSSVRYEVALFRNDEDDAVAVGHFVHVYVDRGTRRPVPIPDDTRAFLAALQPSS